MSPAPRDPFLSALVLAGTVLGDATCLAAQLDPRLRARLEDTLREHEAARARDREAGMRALALTLASPAPACAEQAPPRVRSVLATVAERDRAARWQRDAPVPRAGFRASAALRTTLASLAEEDAWRA